MLRTLHIRDFVIVDKAEIHFEPGFTVFSGETGAGKSILIDALSLTLGGLCDTGVIRERARRTDISAIFDVPDTLSTWLEEHGFDHQDDLILRRTVDTQGRSRGYINGVPTTLSQLRQVSENLIDIHGQHAHQSLLKPTHQRALLDAQGAHLELSRDVRQAWLQWQTAENALRQATEHAATREQERQALEWQLADLTALDLKQDEWDALTNDHNRLAHAQALLDGASQALVALDADDISARTLLNRAASQLQRLRQHDAGLDNITASLDSALIATDEAISDLNSYLSDLDLDPDALAQAEQRMSAIFDTARKLRVEPAELPALKEQLRSQLDAHQQAADTDKLAERVQAAKSHYDTLAQQLTAARRKTG